MSPWSKQSSPEEYSRCWPGWQSTWCATGKWSQWSSSKSPLKILLGRGEKAKVLKQQRQKSSKKVGMDQRPPRWGPSFSYDPMGVSWWSRKQNERVENVHCTSCGTTSGGAFVGPFSTTLQCQLFIIRPCEAYKLGFCFSEKAKRTDTWEAMSL